MKTTLRDKTLWLIISILVSISLPAGIIMIIFGFALEGMAWVAILGIVFVVHGFYGITFYWMQFAKVSKYHRVVRMVERLHMTKSRGNFRSDTPRQRFRKPHFTPCY